LGQLLTKRLGGKTPAVDAPAVAGSMRASDAVASTRPT
jgi:hypothetical protein